MTGLSPRTNGPNVTSQKTKSSTNRFPCSASAQNMPSAFSKGAFNRFEIYACLSRMKRVTKLLYTGSLHVSQSTVSQPGVNWGDGSMTMIWPMTLL